MKTITTIALLFPLISFCQYNLNGHYLDYDKKPGTDQLKKFTYENLRLYPIIAKDSFKLAFKNLTKFTPLKKALEQKKAVITEKGTGAEVNTLTIENKSKDTIIINSGEVIKGGQQDRVINTDMVLYPNSGKKDLPVFCVEHGRWSVRNQSTSSGVRGTNNQPGNGSFNSYSFSSMELRKVVAKENQQQKVWQKVEDINKSNSSENSTGTYTELEKSSGYKTKIDKYVPFFTNALKNEKDIVGVVVVTGDKILGADIFATNELFMQNLDGLLHSYATDAIINGKPVNISQDAVDKYINDLLSNDKKQEETIKKKGSKFENNGKKLRISSFQ